MGLILADEHGWYPNSDHFPTEQLYGRRLIDIILEAFTYLVITEWEKYHIGKHVHTCPNFLTNTLKWPP